MIRLKYDSRDKIFSQRFGQIVALSEIPDEINFDTHFPDEVQPMGDVKCVAYSVCDQSEDQQKIEFDINSINDLWSRVPKYDNGSDPREVFGEAVKNGLQPKGATTRMSVWKSFWRADIGMKDPFDNVRSTMMLIKQPVTVGTYWYQEWNGEILPIGKTPRLGHAYNIHGWKQINGQPHFIIQAWDGRTHYMSREVFNAALKPYGMQTWVLSTAEIDQKRIKSLTDTIKDFCINLIIVLRNLIKEKEKETVLEPVPEPSIVIAVEDITPPKYDWDVPDLARHSVRVICDEMGLSVADKNEVDATIGAESGWNPKAVGKVNPDKYKSRDYGICQINDYYWIGAGKPFPSTQYVLDNPEACVRWMCKQWKAGNKNWWYGYKNGGYKKFL